MRLKINVEYRRRKVLYLGRRSRILLISTTEPINALGPLLEVAQSDDYPIDALHQALQETYPQFDVFVSEKPPLAPARPMSIKMFHPVNHHACYAA